MSSNSFSNRHYMTSPLLEETPYVVPVITPHAVSCAPSWLLQKLPLSWPEPGQSTFIVTVLTPCHCQECSQHCHTEHQQSHPDLQTQETLCICGTTAPITQKFP